MNGNDGEGENNKKKTSKKNKKSQAENEENGDEEGGEEGLEASEENEEDGEDENATTTNKLSKKNSTKRLPLVPKDSLELHHEEVQAKNSKLLRKRNKRYVISTINILN